MADLQRFTLATDIKVYFFGPPAEPLAVWFQRERQWAVETLFPKGTDLSAHSQAKPNAVARQLNERLRKTLGFQTPAERFNVRVASFG